MADPFTALGASLSIIQLVTIAATVATKVWKFKDDKAALPENLESIKQRLDIMLFTLNELKTDGYSEEAAASLETFLAGIHTKLTKFERILDDYIPAVGSSTMERIKKGFQSLAKDSRVADFAEQISKDVDHLTLFIMTQGLKHPSKLSTSPIGTHTVYAVARRGVANFVGRENHMLALHTALEDGGCVAVLQGMGGQGKTQIALEYCRRARIHKKYKAILWANASSEQSIRDSFESLSDVLHPESDSLVDSDSRIRFTKTMLTNWTDPWLLVLDNFDEPDAFSIRDYMPSSLQGRILLTTRSPELGRLGKHIPVTGMTDEEAIKLLITSAHLETSDDTVVNECVKIVRRLGNMPLAIDLAGTYLSKRAGVLRIQDFMARYNEQAEAVMQVLPGVSDYSMDLGQNNTSVFATWEMTLRLLEPDTSAGAQRIAFLNILGFFDGREIREDMFRAYYVENKDQADLPSWFQLFINGRGEWDSLAFEDLAIHLGTMNLMEPPVRDDLGHVLLSVHPLISDWLRIRQTQHDGSDGQTNFQLSAKIISCSLALTYVNFLLQPGFKMTFREQNSLTAHLLFRQGFSDALRNLLPIFTGSSDVLQCADVIFFMYLYDVGFNPASLKISEWVWENCDISSKQGQLVKRAAGAYMWHNLCSVHSHSAAEQRMRTVADFWSSTLGDTHSFTLEARYYAAASLSYLGDMDKAAEEYRHILENADSDEWRQSCQENIWFPRPEWSLVELIYVLGAQRSANIKAEVPIITKQVLDMRRRTATVRHGSTEWNWRCYSMMIKTVKDKTLNSGFSWELLSIIEKVWGKLHSNYFLAQIAVMEALLDRESEASSERILTHLLQSLDRTQFSSSYRYLLWGLQSLSQMLLRRKKFKDAENVLGQMLDVYENLPESASAKNSVLRDLGRCLYLQGDTSRANDALDAISSTTLDVLVLQSLVKYKMGTTEALDNATRLLEDALQYFVISPEEGSGDDTAHIAMQEFSLESMLTGADETTARNKYKFDVNGIVSYEVLILLALCEIRLGNLGNGANHISDGEKTFEEDGGAKAGLTTDFAMFIADRCQELLTLLENDSSPFRVKDNGIHLVVELIEWAIKLSRDNDELLNRLQSLAADLRRLEDNSTASPPKLIDDNLPGAQDREGIVPTRKSGLSRFARNILGSGSSSKKSPNGSEDRKHSFSSDAITLTPSYRSTMTRSPESDETPKPLDAPSTSPHYHVPGELPPSLI